MRIGMVAKATVAATAAMLLALLVLPGGVSAQPRGLVSQLAAGDCAAERADVGRKSFRKRYGRKRGMAVCIKAHRAEARRAIGVATAACREELDEWGLDEFLADWESFEECVATYAEWELDGGLEDDPGDGEEADPEDPGDPDAIT